MLCFISGWRLASVVATAAVATLALPLWAQSSRYTIDTVVGRDYLGEGLPAVEARLDRLNGVALNPSGRLIFGIQSYVRLVDENGSIQELAGTGLSGVRGDGGPATAAAIVAPAGMDYDSAGNLYFADPLSHRVRRIAPDGIITTFAGSRRGFAGDGGPAVEAQLNQPWDVKADSVGNIYICDRLNHRVRRVGRDGIITTVAGSGEIASGFSGDGGLATEARLDRPQAIDVTPSGVLYIADTRNDRIRLVNPVGFITTIAGSGDRGFAGDGGPASQADLGLPAGVLVDGDRNIYISDTFNRRVRRVRASDGVIETIAGSGSFGYNGDGPALDRSLDSPGLLTLDADKRLYIADPGAGRIRRVSSGMLENAAGRSPVAGDGGPATEATLSRANGVWAAPSGEIYIADRENHIVRRVSAGGIIETIAGTGRAGFSGDGGPATEAQLRFPRDIALGPTGELYIADESNRRLRVVDPDGTIRTFAGTGRPGNTGDGGPALEATFSTVTAVVVDAEGVVYVADRVANVVRRIGRDLNIERAAGLGGSDFSLGLGPDGGPATAAPMGPSDLALDQEGNLLVADFRNDAIRSVDPQGIITTIAGGGQTRAPTAPTPGREVRLLNPSGIDRDASGNTYFSDVHVIYKLSPDGILEPVAGTALAGFEGDGGPALEALLNAPMGVSLDALGAVLFADTNNFRIRKLSPVPVHVSDNGVSNAASFAGGSISPNMIASIFGAGLAAETTSASGLPLPVELGDTRVGLVDSTGQSRSLALFFVSSGQINALIPDEVALGAATLSVETRAGEASTPVQIEATAPGLFSINASGAGPAAASAIRIDAEGNQTAVTVFDDAQQPIVATPINLGPESDTVVLLLFGTGIRGASALEVAIGGERAQTLGFAAQPEFAGLDQINAVVPRSLAGRGEVDVVVTIDGKQTNAVTISVR